MIKVGMDIRPLLKEGSGVGYYIKGLVTAMSSYPDVKMELFSSSWKDRFDVSKHFPGVDISLHDCRYPVSLLNFFWERLEYPMIERFIAKVDIVHSPYSYFIPTKSNKEIITIHDLFHLKKPELAGIKDVKLEFALIKRSAEKAQKIIAVSEFTKNDIMNILNISGEKIEVIHSAPSLKPNVGANGESHETKTGQARGPAPTILTVGTLEHRKNYIKLLEAFKIAKNRIKDLKLVIVGKDGFGEDEIRKKIAELSQSELQSKEYYVGARHAVPRASATRPYNDSKTFGYKLDDITLMGYIDEENLKEQYYNADLFVFPSIEEGFGFPPLDAMNFNIPVISSKAGALPEILKDAAFYIEHDKPESIADGIIKVLEDEGLREELVQKGIKLVKTYSWEETAERSYRLYMRIIERS